MRTGRKILAELGEPRCRRCQPGVSVPVTWHPPSDVEGFGRPPTTPTLSPHEEGSTGRRSPLLRGLRSIRGWRQREAPARRGGPTPPTVRQHPRMAPPGAFVADVLSAPSRSDSAWRWLSSPETSPSPASAQARCRGAQNRKDVRPFVPEGGPPSVMSDRGGVTCPSSPTIWMHVACRTR